jgi:hypothetical protein
MKTKLTPVEMSTLVPCIIKVLETGKPWEAEEMHHPAGAIIAAVLSIGGIKKPSREEDGDGSNEGFSTNGWQYDWWQKFTYRDKNYTLSGSGFLGGHSFHLSDE